MNQSNPRPYKQNQQVWDRMVGQTHRFTKPARDQDFQNPLKAVDTLGWMGPSIQGLKVLCLAAGGGRQGPLFAAAGGNVTVVDISAAMLELDQKVAMQRGLNLTTCQTSMDDLQKLGAARFDLVAQPVSTCYVPDIVKVYQEVAFVTKPNGLYISQHKQPTSLQSSTRPVNGKYRLEEAYYQTQPLPDVGHTPFREQGAVEFLHRWEEIIGGMCQSGFLIEDLSEPYHADEQSPMGEFGHRCRYMAPYVRIKARRNSTSTSESSTSESSSPELWVPE